MFGGGIENMIKNARPTKQLKKVKKPGPWWTWHCGSENEITTEVFFVERRKRRVNFHPRIRRDGLFLQSHPIFPAKAFDSLSLIYPKLGQPAPTKYRPNDFLEVLLQCSLSGPKIPLLAPRNLLFSVQSSFLLTRILQTTTLHNTTLHNMMPLHLT